jgi:hypothetical protein
MLCSHIVVWHLTELSRSDTSYATALVDPKRNLMFLLHWLAKPVAML